MGSYLSINSRENATMEWLMKEANRLTAILTSMISSTLEISIGYVDSLDDRAESLISTAMADIQEYLAEWSTQGAPAQACVNRKQSEIDALRAKMKRKLLDCYKTQTTKLDQLQKDRNRLHDEAMELKTLVEDILSKCTESASSLECFTKQIYKISKNVKSLMAKIEAHAKREFNVRKTVILKMLQCDANVIQKTYKDSQVIVKEIQKCLKESGVEEPEEPQPETITRKNSGISTSV